MIEDLVEVQCPYCAERMELTVDPETEGTLVQDCEVCCRPWSLSVERDADGTPRVRIERAQ